jgi:hypothetical protein
MSGRTLTELPIGVAGVISVITSSGAQMLALCAPRSP